MQAATRPMASTIRTEHPCGRHLAWNDDATIAAWHLLAAWCPDIGPAKQTSQNAYPVFNGALEDTRPSPDFWLSWGGRWGVSGSGQSPPYSGQSPLYPGQSPPKSGQSPCQTPRGRTPPLDSWHFWTSSLGPPSGEPLGFLKAHYCRILDSRSR